MALNLFGPPTKDDIKVSYIDPILGLVEGVSIAEANEYDKKQPGTTFIFRNGNQTLQYLNINEINQLDPNVLIATDECGGISQKKECGPPTIQIFGGAGIGAVGNPIVGNDGALLAVDLINGGNGYQYPPLVSAKDICNYGSGASFTTIIDKGVVTDVIISDPGNGYLSPIAPTTSSPSLLTPIQSDIPGVPGVPSVPSVPGVPGVPSVPSVPGAPGVPGVPSAPGVPSVPSVPGAPGVPGVPSAPGVPSVPGAPGVPSIPGVPSVSAVPLFIPSPPSGASTGINASFRPQFEVVRDPIVVSPQKLLQVTDLVGLKQTGYVNGRAYYGAVYYDNGIRYAGFYETIGEPVRVYDTLRESIIAQVTTPPSAILRQGTDIRSNNPLLNIPGTIQSTLNSNSIVGAGDISAPSVPFVQEPVQDPIYPVSLRLKRVLVEDPGINYNVTDQIRVIPSNGAVLEPVFGSFGRVIRVAVIDPGFGFTEYPRIEMFTPL